MSAASPHLSVDSNASPVSPASQRSAFPFPAHDVSPYPPRSSSTSRFARRRDSSASTASVGSIGGSLDMPNRRGPTVRETSHNAISTLLQPPIVRTGLVPHTQASAAAAGFKPPTARDIPPVALTNLPHVPPDNFRDYLARIGPLFDSFQRGRAEPEQSAWLKKDQELEKADRFAEALERKMSRDASVPSTPELSRRSSTATLSPATERPGLPQRKSSAQTRRNRNEPTPLSTIPNVYFDEDFHLENPRTFDVVSERAEIVRPPPGTVPSEPKALANGAPFPPRKALATNAILQEKLSWYMDTVEVHLINNISTASSGFFAALGSLKELQTEAEESVAKIQRLREDLRRLDKDVAVSGLEVAAKRRRRDNVRRLAGATRQVQKVSEIVNMTDSLVDEGAYDEAADQMDLIGRLICGRPDAGQEDGELIDLRPLKALQGLDSGLQELQLRIGTGFAQRFTAILMKDLRHHLEEVPARETLQRWSRQRGIPPTYMETSQSFRQDLRSALNGLSRAGHTAPATAAYRESVNKEMKALIRKFLPSSSDDDADSMVSTSTRGGTKLSQQEKSSVLARNLRALDAEDAEKLLINVYASVGEALRRVSTQTKILLDVTSSMQAMEPRSLPKSPNLATVDEQTANGAPKPPTATVQEELSQALDLSSLLGQAVDTAQTQITRVLKVRNEQSTQLPKEMFLRYFTLNRLFADECEAISGRGGSALKGIVNAQISGFVQALGAAETERIANALDKDTWNAEDFDEKHNAILQRVLASMSSNPPEWTKSAIPLWERPDFGIKANGDIPMPNGTATPNGEPAPGKKEIKPAYIDESRYVLVASAASLLSTIDTFLSLAATLPSMTPQISTSLLEVLRTFNSRSSQLILGAGATRIAGLKNITTKHLALASQALSFIIALVPYMRECIRRHIPGGQSGVLAEFDKTKRLYQDHQSGIHDKLVDIMTSRSQAHVKAMHAVNFDRASSADEDTAKPSPYMETLTKESLTLHRVLSRHLSDLDVRLIMRQIFASYKDQWLRAFADVDVQTPAGEKRLSRDAELLAARLGKIENFADIASEIVALVKAKTTTSSGVASSAEEVKGTGPPNPQQRAPVEEEEEKKLKAVTVEKEDGKQAEEPSTVADQEGGGEVKGSD